MLRRPDALRRRRAGRARQFDVHAVRRRDDGRHRADHADGRAGRLPALHARAHRGATARRWWAGVLVGGPGWVVLGVRQDAGRRAARLPGDQPRRCRPTARSTRTRCTWPPTSTCSRTTAGRSRPRRCSSWSRSSRSTSPTPMPARSRGRTSSRALTHSHPGRVVWVVFNTLIALMLMELNVFQALGNVLGLYSNIAIAWMMAVVADLVINKPLGLSPPGIEFKRAHLYDINPVGVGAMGAGLGAVDRRVPRACSGRLAQAFSALIALGTAFVAAPLIAWATQGQATTSRATPQPPSACRVDRSSYGALHAALRDLRARVRRPTTWRIARPTAAASARCAARSTRAATTCASRRRAWSAQWQAALRCAAAAPRVAVPRHRARPLPAADADRRAAAGRRCSACSTTQELRGSASGATARCAPALRCARAS